MNKIVKYRTILRTVASTYTGKCDGSEFEAEINALIEKGYQPYGPLQVTPNFGATGGYLYFTQVMVKYD